MKDLGEVIDWVEMGNKTLFNPLDTKAILYLFENSYQEVEGGFFKQRRRSLPLDALVFEAFPDMYKNLIRFIQSKLLTKKSEVRLGLVFKPFSLDKKRRLMGRIKTMIEKNNEVNNRLDDDYASA